MDDQPSGSCPTCRRRDARVPQICDPCRSRLRSWVFDIPSLYAELEERIEVRSEPSDVRPFVATVAEWTGREIVQTAVVTARPADPVAYHLPSGASSSASRGGPVSGSKEKRLPIDTDAVDLTGPVRSAGVAVLDVDAVGYESVASVLDFWVEDWRADRGAGERRPSATVPELTRWLLERLDDACDGSPSIEEFYTAIGRLRRALQHECGQIDIPDYKRFTPCPRCSSLTLVHHNGSQFVECSTCPAVLSFLEYDEHARVLSTQYDKARRARVAQIKTVRRLLESLRAAGWRYDRRREFGDEFALLVVHRWRRGSAAVEAWAQDTDGSAQLTTVWWVADEANPSVTLSVSGDWVDTYGIPALTKLARAAGILTPVKQKETAA